MNHVIFKLSHNLTTTSPEKSFAIVRFLDIKYFFFSRPPKIFVHIHILKKSKTFAIEYNNLTNCIFCSLLYNFYTYRIVYCGCDFEMTGRPNLYYWFFISLSAKFSELYRNFTLFLSPFPFHIDCCLIVRFRSWLEHGFFM